MSYNISKELFEAVMNVKLTTDLSIAPYYNEVNGCEEEDLILINYNFIWIPLDTFFFKCKEWAYKSGYVIDSRTSSAGSSFIYERDYHWNIPAEVKKIVSSSEQQAVFDACQWIMDNKGKL